MNFLRPARVSPFGATSNSLERGSYPDGAVHPYGKAPLQWHHRSSRTVNYRPGVLYSSPATRSPFGATAIPETLPCAGMERLSRNGSTPSGTIILRTVNIVRIVLPAAKVPLEHHRLPAYST